MPCKRRAVGVLVGVSALVVAVAATGSVMSAAAAGTARERTFDAATSISNNVLQLALNAATCAQQTGVVQNERYLTVIDYSKPSTEPRLWVLDLDADRVVFQELVAHGRGSGDNFATKFSNDDGSHATSLGLFRTADTYVGSNGYSLRLDGLEPGVNDRARERAIVMHGAAYVNAAMSRTVGRLGRSWGCPALRPSVARTVIDTIKNGSLVFAYYPDKQWLRASRFLNGCS
jgi:hypothetical protein